MDSIGEIAARRAVEAQAERLALAFGGPPSDLTGVAGTVGIIHHFVGDIDAAALLRVGPVRGVWGVTLRKGDSFVRRRFSLAHEIAHLALGIVGDEERYMGEVAARRTRTPEEATCDYFAACLLMPRPWMMAAATSIAPKHLARTFDVSTEALKVRLRELGLNAIAKEL